MKRAQLLLLALLAVVIVLGSAWAYRTWRQQQKAAPALAGLSPLPDLSRWPSELKERVTRATAAVTTAADPAEPLGQLALLYFSNDYTTEAEKALRTLIQLQPRNARWFYLLGTLRLRMKDDIEAEQFFAQTTRLDPSYAPGWLKWGDRLAVAGRWPEAQECFERCLSLRPTEPEANYALAKLHFARGNEGAARQVLESLVRTNPRFQDAHVMLGDLYAKEGDAIRAAEQRAFLRSGRPSPPTSDPWIEQAYLLSYDAYRMQVFGGLRAQAGQNEIALPYLERAAQLDPTDVDARGLLANTYIALGRLPEAEHTLQEGLKLTPESEVMEARIAQVLLKEGHGEEALKRIDRALALKADRPLLYRSKGEILQQLNRPAEAVTSFRDALRLDPISVEAQLNLGRCLLLSGHREEGKAALLRAHQLRPEEPEALGALASLELEDRQLDQAEHYVEQLYQRDSERPQTRELYALIKLRKGNALAEAGKHAEAETVYQDGLKVNPGYGPLQGGLGMLYGKLRRFADAETCFKRYLELTPSDPLGYILLGSAYASLGRPTDAKETWSRGLTVAQQTKNEARARQLEQLLRR